MKRIIRMVSSLLVICAILFNMNILAQASGGQNYNLNDYQVLLNYYNSSCGTTFSIVDYDAFYANVYNKMSPEELVNSLSERGSFSNIHGSTTKGTKCIMRVQPNEQIRYTQTITGAGYSGEVFATIETRFPNPDKRYFVKYINSGYVKKRTGYYFSTTSASCVSCTATLCVVKYAGSWVNATTGICDCVLRTYNVPFTP